MNTLRRLFASIFPVFLALPAGAADAPGRDRLAYALTGGRVLTAPGRIKQKPPYEKYRNRPTPFGAKPSSGGSR